MENSPTTTGPFGRANLVAIREGIRVAKMTSVDDWKLKNHHNYERIKNTDSLKSTYLTSVNDWRHDFIISERTEDSLREADFDDSSPKLDLTEIDRGNFHRLRAAKNRNRNSEFGWEKSDAKRGATPEGSSKIYEIKETPAKDWKEGALLSGTHWVACEGSDDLSKTTLLSDDDLRSANSNTNFHYVRKGSPHIEDGRCQFSSKQRKATNIEGVYWVVDENSRNAPVRPTRERIVSGNENSRNAPVRPTRE